MHPLLGFALAAVCTLLSDNVTATGTLSTAGEISHGSASALLPAGSYPHTSDHNTPKFTFDELYHLQTRFWDAFLYPADLAQAASINSSLLAPDCLGRVDITRTFDGAELNTEYLFGLFAHRATQSPSSVSLIGLPISYEIIHFAANEYIASAATIVMFNLTALGGVLLPIEIDTWIAFNDAGQIWQYDATFRRFDFFLDTLIAAAMPALNASTHVAAVAIITEGIATGICETHQMHCNGSNQQYESFDACYSFLTQQVRFGKAYELGRNTLLCRMLHENMIPFRPAVHCPHVGPSGGGQCVDDMMYADKVLQPYYTHLPFVPYGYESKNATVAAMR